MPVTISRTQLVIATLAIVALAFGVLTWGQGAPTGTQAANTGAKTQMDLVITGTFGATPIVCDSGAGDTKCTLETGSAFTVQVVPSTIPVGGYASWQTLITYGALLYQPRAQEITFFPSAFPYRVPQQPSGKEGSVSHYDVTAMSPDPGTGLWPASMQKSTFLTLNFNCARNAGGNFSDTISIIDYNEDFAGGLFIEPDGITLHIPNLGSLDVNCSPVPTKQPDPGDSDGDGCSDQAENGPEARFGGQRNYLYFWDFYDVWTHPPGDPLTWERNGVINVFDILRVAQEFGVPTSYGSVLNNNELLVARALTPPPDLLPPGAGEAANHNLPGPDSPSYDRSENVGPNAWDRGPPDGVINVVHDILGVAIQFGHDCT